LYRRGLLHNRDLNEVQLALFQCALVREEERRDNEEEAKFYNNMFLQQPALYQKVMEDKRRAEGTDLAEEFGLDKIVWKTPKTKEEAQEVAKAFADLDRRFKKMQQEDDTLTEVVQRSTLTFLDDADLRQLRE